MQANVTELHSWQQIDWKATEASVKHLRQRIYVASRNKPTRLLERLAGKLARAVLRGVGSREVSWG